ncbi:MAG TPA: 8-amino-7-oxononanoate synthase, partial [Sphingomicrobium sp.]|nr:8-amino-7-oxononanoate synthase [Sphingomicrobium sp.]
AFAATRLEPLGAAYHESQILPLIIGDAPATMQLASSLQRAGFDARGIRPPTVPDGTSRIRISITLNVDRADITGLADSIRAARA